VYNLRRITALFLRRLRSIHTLGKGEGVNTAFYRFTRFPLRLSVLVLSRVTWTSSSFFRTLVTTLRDIRTITTKTVRREIWRIIEMEGERSTGNGAWFSSYSAFLLKRFISWNDNEELKHLTNKSSLSGEWLKIYILYTNKT